MTSQYRPSLSATLRYGTQLGTGNAASSIGFIRQFAVTILFKADVEAQGGANGCAGVDEFSRICCNPISHHRRSKRGTLAFGIITLVFHTTIVMERPGGSGSLPSSSVQSSLPHHGSGDQPKYERSKLKWMKLPSLYC